MSRHERRKPKGKKSGASQRMNRLKAKALTQVAGQAWSFNQRHTTIALLAEAHRREPTNTDTILKLASAYGRQRFYESTEELLARLLHLAPRKASVCHQAAQVFAAIDRPDRAIECYRRSLDLYLEASKKPPALVELAGLYERRHD